MKSFEDQEQVKDSLKGKTTYEYQKLNIKYSSLAEAKKVPTTASLDSTATYPLRAICYPSKVDVVREDGIAYEKVFYYYGITRNCYDQGFTEKPFLLARTIHANNYAVSGENIQVQVEAPNYTQYDENVANPVNGKLTKDYSALVQYYVGDMETENHGTESLWAVDYYFVKYTFYKDHRIIKEEKTDKDGN